MSGAPVLKAALWISMLASLAIGVMSLQAGTAPEWVVLRAVGTFSSLMMLGLIAQAVTSQGLRHPPPRPRPDESDGSAGRALEPEILTGAEMQEAGHD